MNKTLLSLISALSLGALSLQAQTAPAASSSASTPAAAPAPAPASDVTVTLTPSYVSQYMFRGQRLGGPSFEPSVEADGSNWDLGIWANSPIEDKVPGQSDPEIDPYGSYTYNISDALSLQPGFTYYTYVRAPLDQGFYRSTFEPNVALNYTIDGVKITPKFYYDIVLDAPTYELNAAYTVPLKDIGSELDFAGTVGSYVVRQSNDVATPATATKVWGDYWLLGVSAPYQITKDLKLTLGWAYTRGQDAYTKTGTQPETANPEAVGRGVFSAALAYTF